MESVCLEFKLEQALHCSPKSDSFYICRGKWRGFSALSLLDFFLPKSFPTRHQNSAQGGNGNIWYRELANTPKCQLP